MEQKYKIGIVGIGMVGGAMKRYFENKPSYELFLYDVNGVGSLEDIKKADFIYLCVPTPYVNGVGCDTSIVEEVVDSFKDLVDKVFIIKSTVSPGTTDKLQRKYRQHKFLFNPEFLTEETSDQDINYPDRQIVGYTKESFTISKDILQQLPNAPFERIVPAFIAEFVKYAGNTWFSVKVAKNNELYDIFRGYGGTDSQFGDMISCIAADKRIGRTHLKIWHKGKRGYGGKCLPKDIKAFIDFARHLGVNVPVMEAVDSYNEKLIIDQGLDPLNTGDGKKKETDNSWCSSQEIVT
jgi:UDPglucose 6-dehydrogenase